jgi:hypothetical protein
MITAIEVATAVCAPAPTNQQKRNHHDADAAERAEQAGGEAGEWRGG